jgi:long-chain fatty acid transport protein
LPDGKAKIDLPLAHAYRMDARWQATDDLALTFGGAFEQWDTLKNTQFDLGPAGGKIPLGFKNTYKLRGGVHYRIDEKWLVQTGVSYDSSALNTSDRIAALPIDEQWRWGIGGVYEWSENTTLGFGFQYLNGGDANLSEDTIGAVTGNYKNNDFFFFMINLNFAKLPWDGMATF